MTGMKKPNDHAEPTKVERKNKRRKVTSQTKINKYYNHVSKKTADFFFAQTYLDVQY